MTHRFLVYPLLMVVALQLVPLLRARNLIPILQRVLILLLAGWALITRNDWFLTSLAWSLFALFVVIPRCLMWAGTRLLMAGNSTLAARYWRQTGWLTGSRAHQQFAVALATGRAEPPGSQPGESGLWQLWAIAAARQWQAVVDFYDNVESWETLTTALQARLVVARALAEIGQFDRALRSLTFVALSLRTIGPLARQYWATRAEVLARIDAGQYAQQLDMLRHAERQTGQWRALMSWGRPAPVTVGLLAVLAVVFGIEVIWFRATPLYNWFGNLPLPEMNGEWYRPTTALFLHAGILHLSMNAAALWMFGTAIERTAGWWRMLVIFFVGGTLANLASAWHGGFDVSVGASSGLFSLVAAYGVTIYRLRGPVFAGVRQRMLRMLALLLLADALIGGLETQIDNIAHIGGFVAGLVLAFLILPRRVNGAH